MTIPKYPAELGPAGKKFWKEVHAAYVIDDVDRREKLAIACRSLDDEAAAAEVIERDGRYIPAGSDARNTPQARFANSIALLLIAAGLFTLSYVLYRQEDRGRWIPTSYRYDGPAVVDSYTGRVWSMVHEGSGVYDVELYDVTEGKFKIFPQKNRDYEGVSALQKVKRRDSLFPNARKRGVDRRRRRQEQRSFRVNGKQGDALGLRLRGVLWVGWEMGWETVFIPKKKGPRFLV